jgi:hypothetical protein
LLKAAQNGHLLDVQLIADDLRGQEANHARRLVVRDPDHAGGDLQQALLSRRDLVAGDPG